MARRGKFARVVDGFVATVTLAGGRVDRTAVATELQARIDAISTQMGVSKPTVLRDYIPDDWGVEMATGLLAGAVERPAVPRQRTPQQIPVAVVGRLIAALGQAMVFSAANGDHKLEFPALNALHAADAVSGLGLAISERQAGGDLVTIGPDTVELTRAALETLRDQLRAGVWSSCPCGERHGQAQVNRGVLKAVEADLLLLPRGSVGHIPPPDLHATYKALDIDLR